MADPRSESERRYPAWLVGGTVPRHAWDEPAAMDLLARNQPVVLTGCPLVGLGLDFAKLSARRSWACTRRRRRR